MEDLVKPGDDFWRGRRVLLTGHTGFKGSWLALSLAHLGAEVHGYALDPEPGPNMFDAAGVRGALTTDTRADLTDPESLRTCLEATDPELVLHLAAQSLVRVGYADPVRTFATNVMGTVNLLESARACDSLRALVVVTTDKVYENLETGRAFRETDPLGGHDPYSASKAATELATAGYRASFFSDIDRPWARVATARSGNVIGGGDWSPDRLVPDCLAAFAHGRSVTIRNPTSVRPWQHVLEPLAGYLALTEALAGPEGGSFSTGWNFGPDADADASVLEVAGIVAECWGEGASTDAATGATGPHEAGLLHLDSCKARSALDWRPRWSLRQAIEATVEWHKEWLGGADMHARTVAQVESYERAGARHG